MIVVNNGVRREMQNVAALRQVAPGRYDAQVPLAAASSAPWRFELLPGAGISAADVTRIGSRRLFYSYPDEYRLLPANLVASWGTGCS